MSELKTFLFLHAESGRVLAVKKSRGLDFSIASSLWRQYCLISEDAPELQADHLKTWDPVGGLRAAAAPNPAELREIQLLRKKVETLLSLKASLHVIESQMKPQFSAKRMMSVPIDKRNFFKFWKLMRTERSILRRKMKDFFEEMRQKVETAPDVESLDLFFKDLTINFTLGGYAAMSRDIEGDHVKRN